MHPSEQWVEAVVVVVDLDAGLTGKGAGDTADVLDDPASARDREGKEEGVEFGEVEAFAEVGAGGQQQDRVVAGPAPARLFSETPWSLPSTKCVEVHARARLGEDTY